MKQNLLNLSFKELQNSLEKLGEKKFRANQVFDWLYKKNVLDLNKFTNFSQELKNKIIENFEIKFPEISNVAKSGKDNSYKFLLKAHDNNFIESILMLSGDRVTLCVSCMIGCPLKCKFCATGSQVKYVRNLESSEILGQILVIKDYIIKNKISPKISNIVFMGMGEPLLNISNISKTIEILLDPNAFGISRSKITLSTAGVAPGLSELINKFRIKLALSLHFATDEQRSQFMPINQKYNLKDIMTEVKKINLGARDFITIEYIMLKNINDRIQDAQNLVNLLRNLKVKINLIPYNKIEYLKNIEPSDEDSINKFAKFIILKNIMVTVRRSFGQDISGACGQFLFQKLT